MRPVRKLLPLFPSFPVGDFFVFSPTLFLSYLFLFSCYALVLRGPCACTIPASLCRPADPFSLSVRLRRCAAHGGVMATLSWLWGSPRARSHPHAMWKGDQYLTLAIPAFPPRGRSSVPFRQRTVAPILMSVVSLALVGVVAVMVVVASKQSLEPRFIGGDV